MPLITKILRVIVGEPLSNDQIQDEKIPKRKALAVLASDALSSTAYATDEILLALVAVSTAAMAWSIPIALIIGGVIVIVAFSYWKMIEVYQGGCSAYTVAKENLGIYSGLTAGAALMIDYVLTVAVSVAAGVSAMTSAFPSLHDHKALIGSGIVLVIMCLNLRGKKDSATIFAYPTYFFVVSMFGLIASGLFQLMTGLTQPVNVIIPSVMPDVAVFVALKAFSSGCTALTGIEAISNSVPSFRRPQHQNAKITLAWMAGILAVLFIGVTILARQFGIVPMTTETVVSQIAHAVLGHSFGYYLIQISTALILFLAANTTYNGFPWLASILAKDRFLPRQFAILGDRLVFSNSIVGLSVAVIFLLMFFGGDTHRLIPLYAIGVFMAFTLSQLGMVVLHWTRRQQGWKGSLLVHGIGACVTGVVLIVVAVTKFNEGAWIVLLMIPFLVYIFTRVHEHYEEVGRALAMDPASAPKGIKPFKHTVIIPLSGIHRGILDAIRYAISISDDVRACYVELDPAATSRIQVEWNRWAPNVQFVVLKSPYRSVVGPLLSYIDSVEGDVSRDYITVVIPEFVTAKWYHGVLHNQTAFLIRAALLFRKRKVVTSVRYHLRHT